MMRLSDARGFTLLEVLVAASLLIVVFFGLTEVFTRARRQIGFEEDRRRATAVLQDRIETLRDRVAYERLPALGGRDTTYVRGGRRFRVSHAVAVDSPEPQTTTVTLDVSWSTPVGAREIERSLSATTLFGRGVPWE
ncbi:MAG: prepilin-type N-terminal cleavage/methylation domain-containing protein [Candidatus Eisenbacteria bacterium]|nr:prepilin-type N-terminal cleavage/methylation domain-containing protein [Candidatus Eisenbacteria bacterium]